MLKRLALVMVLIGVLLVPMTASAQTGSRLATVGVDDVTVHVGDTFTVPVWIHGVSNLYGYDIRLPHDQSVLQGVSVDHGGWLVPGFVIRQGFWTWGGPGCNGYCAWYAMTQLRPSPPVSGSGVLVNITYTALQPGTVELVPWAQLSAAGGIPIYANTQTATVTVLASDNVFTWVTGINGDMNTNIALVVKFIGVNAE